MINICDLGVLDYKEALSLQHRLLECMKKDESQLDDTLLLVEHPHVLTLGKRGKKENIFVDEEYLEDKGIDVYEINRGGDVTYHGYGQIVGYPIFHLSRHEKNIRLFVERLEKLFIEHLKETYNIDAEAKSGKHTGVWVGDKKITAIGIGVKRYVTYHGFAYNVNTDLEYFSMINPCGLGEGRVTSLKTILGMDVDLNKEKQLIAKKMLKIYGEEGNYLTKKQLEEIISEKETAMAKD